MLLVALGLQASIAPLPHNATFQNKKYPLSSLVVSCIFPDNRVCDSYITDSIHFFLSKVFVRDAPYTVEQYAENGIEGAIDQLIINVKSNTTEYDPRTIDEAYNLTVSEKEILIEAANGFAVSRAMASLIQLIHYNDLMPEDRKGYSIDAAVVSDYSVKPWRELQIDIARHYVPIADILLEIDAMTLAKLNVLKLHISDTEQFDIKFMGEPQNKLLNAAYTKYYYYTLEELAEIQRHCYKRGIFLAYDIAAPAHVHSWKKADASLVANCPAVEEQNVNDVLVNPLNDNYYKTIEGMAQELSKINDLKMPLIMSFSANFELSCWDEDANIQNYLKENKITNVDLLNTLFSKLQAAVSKVPGAVVSVDAFAYKYENAKLDSAVMVVLRDDRSMLPQVVAGGHQMLTGSNWDLTQQSPAGGGHYMHMDIIMDLYKQNIYDGLEGSAQQKAVLGGTAVMDGYVSWGQSQNAEIYPRSFAVVENLWSELQANHAYNNGVQDRFENLGCRYNYYGIQNGPLSPGAPCYGYSHE